MGQIVEFGTTSDGRLVHATSFGTGQLKTTVLTFGATLQDVRLDGIEHPLTLGAPSIAPYEGPMNSFGTYIGPVANRIRNATATIAGQTYTFEKNFQGTHTLHSGAIGTHQQVWSLDDHGPDHVTLSLDMPDGQGGFPGNRRASVTYTTEGRSLSLQAKATTDAPTLLSFANHSYWALDPTPGYAGHTLTVHADRFTDTGSDLLPTGETPDLTGGGQDLRAGGILSGDETQFFDVNYCLSNDDTPLREVAVLRGRSGVTMTMSTTAPGLQVYDGGTVSSAGHPTIHGAPYGHYAGVALEAQKWPGAAEHAHFPSILATPDKPFLQTVRWTFAT